MSNTNTRILEIVDVCAAIALDQIPEIKSGFGVGSGLVDHPRAGTGTIPVGAKILPAPARPQEDFQHWSDMPEQGSLPLQAMQGTHRLTWILPQKLFMGRGRGLDECRRLLTPFHARYIAAFTTALILRGLVEQISAMTFRIESDEDWAWLNTRLTVVERLNLATAA